MSFVETMKEKARQNIKTILLPESEDVRVIQAAADVEEEGFAKAVLIGNEENVKQIALDNNIDVSKVTIINPLKSEKFGEYSNKFYELRKAKGMTPEKAKEIMKEPIYFGTMMVKVGDADGIVSGACHPTAHTLRPALQILKTAPGTKLASAFFLMVTKCPEYGEDGVFIFADSGMNEYPDADGLSEIAISSAKSFKQLVGKEPRVAMLSYSTYGSASSPLTEKVIEATRILKEKAPDLLCDGELQLDAAIIPEVAERKAPGSPIAGKANVLIFPDLDAGNIGYKLVQRFGRAEAYGPLCQGIAKAVNDLSRGCSSDDIVGVVAITSVQAQDMENDNN
ncbi:MAG: phosphate acetyltransferase [Clostridia bacterium]|jgi:phosphate acetyltransferase|nr:phosphate acetyltransferase [Clostridia bacterium]CDE82443.1 phosphate acetyltransferase [Clostridium sp. CAG:273]